MCRRQMEEQRAAGEIKTQRTWWTMAGMMQFLAWLMIAICLLPGVTTTQHRAGTRALGWGWLGAKDGCWQLDLVLSEPSRA